MKYHNFITKLAVIFILLMLILGCDKDNSTPPEGNHPPVISSLSAFPSNIEGGETSRLTLVATDQDNDTLSVEWSATGGIFLSTSNDSAVWKAPNNSDTYTCTAKVSDGKATVDSDVSITVTVSNVGNWSGTTSQNYPISFVIEDVGGIVGVTQVNFKIDCQGTGWSATTGGTLTFNPYVEIVNGEFDYSTSTLSVDGTFNNPPTLSGELNASVAHPQGLGTAYGSATYSATKL